MTESGTCVPPGPSKNASGRAQRGEALAHAPRSSSPVGHARTVPARVGPSGRRSYECRGSEAQAADRGRVLRPVLRRRPDRAGQRPPRPAEPSRRRRVERASASSSRSARRAGATGGRPRDARLRELDVPPPLRAAPDRPAGAAAAERRGCARRRGTRVCHAVARVAAPAPHLTSRTSSRPGLALRLLRHQPGPRLGRGGRALREPAQRLLAAAPRRRLHAAAVRPARSSSTLLELGYGVTNAAYRTTPGSGDLRRGDFDAARLERLARELRPRAIAFVGKEAYRGAFGERPELGPQLAHARRRPALFVLPSTSPANAAVPYAERLRWFRALREWLEPVPREAVRALVVDADGAACCSMRFENPATRRRLVGDAGRRRRARARPTRRRCGASSLEEAGLRRADARAASSGRASTSSPGSAGCSRQRERFYLVRVERARGRADDRPRRRGRARPPLVDARRARGDRTSGSRRARSRRACARCSATARRPSRSTSASSLRAPCTRSSSSSTCSPRWSGSAARSRSSSRACPAIRVLEGEPRGRAMRELGLRWRPLGYGALARRGADGRRARPLRLGPTAARRSRPCCG